MLLLNFLQLIVQANSSCLHVYAPNLVEFSGQTPLVFLSFEVSTRSFHTLELLCAFSDSNAYESECSVCCYFYLSILLKAAEDGIWAGLPAYYVAVSVFVTDWPPLLE